HQDAQGSVTLVTNADGSAAKSGYAYYEPFGRRIERMGAPVDGAVGELRLGLTGHEHDDELGLINLKGRMYDPKLTERGAPDIASAGRAAHRAALNRQWRTTTATAYVVATSSSSELFGGRRPSVLPEK
ncbi:MAG TPA: hypothetical protein VL242_00355, partial [Sorangium sp.]|nr:hypothetical protein [Sorangium sp.]